MSKSESQQSNGERPPFHSPADIRRLAEQQLKARNQTLPANTTLESLLHELQVHQIELEMQNEELRQSKLTLETTQAKFFDLFEQAPIGYLTISEQGLIQEANLTAAELLGVDRSKLTRRPLSQFILDQDQDIFYQHLKQLHKTGARQLCEFRMLRKGALVFWTRMEAIVAIGDNGESVLRVTLSDITDSKKMEEDLRILAARLKHATTSAKAGVWDWNLESGEMIWDDRMLELYGITRTTFPGGIEAWTSGLHPDYSTRATEECQAALRGEREFNTEFRIRHPDGAERYIKANGLVLRNKDGKPVRMIGLNTDVTEHHELEGYFKNIVGLASDMLVVAKTSGEFLHVSPSCEKILGYTTEEILKLNWTTLVHPDDVEPTNIKVAEQLQGKMTAEFVNRYRHKNGAYRMLEWMAVLAADGHIYAAARDITERMKAEEELKTKNAEMERFLYTASHDLKTPVVTIQSFMKHLKADMAAADPGRIETDLKFIHMSADRMEHLLDDLLQMSRVGRLIGASSRTTAKVLVDEAINAVAGCISDRGIAVKIADMDVTLCGDRPRLAEIWQNLIENACKFMGDQPAPCIEIGIRREEQKSVEGRTLNVEGEDGTGRPPVRETVAAPDQAIPVFFVRDNGIGIDPKHHDRVFDMFERLDKKIEGTGMGLAIVKRIVELYQGRIWVESAGAGQGASFCFILPGAITTEGKT